MSEQLFKIKPYEWVRVSKHEIYRGLFGGGYYVYRPNGEPDWFWRSDLGRGRGGFGSLEDAKYDAELHHSKHVRQFLIPAQQHDGATQ